MPLRTCSYPECRRLYQPVNSRQRFCRSQCRDRKLGRERRVKRGTTTERGYGSDHRKLRADVKAQVDAGHAYCWRPNCRRWLDPAKPWHLGHDDYDRTIYRGPECVRCNTSHAAKLGNAARGQSGFSSRPRIV